MNIRPSLRQRFFAKVQQTDGCWPWSGCTDSNGYGQVRAKGKMVKAHRVSWLLHYGEIPSSMCVLHKCDNPPCANPDHLFLGTRADNNHDRVEKGRSALGMNNGRAKLTEMDVVNIRRLEKMGEKQSNLSRKWGISTSHVSYIVNRKIWRHV